jgi:hypothetical protein
VASIEDLTDFDALKAQFETDRKHTEAEKLKGANSKKVQQMVQLKKARTDLLEKFKKLIEEYNARIDLDTFFEKRVVFVKELTEDTLSKATPDLSAKEKKEVKKVARKLSAKAE